MWHRVIFICVFVLTLCKSQHGPEPWDNKELSPNLPTTAKDNQLPPDLKRTRDANQGVQMREWFYKRLLTVMLKSGKVTVNEDNKNVDIILQMNFAPDKWKLINDLLESEGSMSEDMFRLSIGYIQDAITKPTLKEKIVVAWSEYIQNNLTQYKMELTWFFAVLAVILAFTYLQERIQLRHLYLLLFIILYLYEVIISYKEAEKQEYEKFLSSLNTCKWYFWSSSCSAPPPDPVLFLKHMHPLSIGIRLISLLISEPAIVISSTVNKIVQDSTDGLWYPLNTIAFGVLSLSLKIIILVFIITIIFNFVFNIPFSFSFLLGLFNIGIKQRDRNLHHQSSLDTESHDRDRLSGRNLNKLLNFYEHALRKSEHKTKSSGKPAVLVKNRKFKNKNRVISIDYVDGNTHLPKLEIGSGDSGQKNSEQHRKKM